MSRSSDEYVNTYVIDYDQRKKNGDDDGNLLLLLLLLVVVITTHKQVNDRMGLTLSPWCMCVCMFAWSSFPSSILLLFFLLLSFFLCITSHFFTSPNTKKKFMYMTQVNIEVNREIDINGSLLM